MDVNNVIRLQQFIFAPLKPVMIKAIELVEAKIAADLVDDEDFIAWYFNDTVDNSTNANTWCAIDVSRVKGNEKAEVGRLSCRVKFWYYNQPDTTGISGYYDLASGEFKVEADVNVHVTKFIYSQLDLLVKQLVTEFDGATALPAGGIFGVQNWADTDRGMPQ